MSINPKGIQAALDYIQTATQPVRNEIKTEIEYTFSKVIGSIVLVFFVIIFCIIVWICYEVDLAPQYIILSFLVLLIVSIISFIVIYYLVAASVQTTSNLISASLTGFDAEYIETNISSILNGAALAYLTALV